jgi:hypothetical protein
MNGNATTPANGWFRALFIASVPAMIAGVTAIIIMGQRQAVTEAELRGHITNQSVLETRINDIDTHGTRQVTSLEARIKSMEDRNIEQDRRIGAIETTKGTTNVRLALVEDRLASCQACHMGGGAKALTDHLTRHTPAPAHK